MHLRAHIHLSLDYKTINRTAHEAHQLFSIQPSTSPSKRTQQQTATKLMPMQTSRKHGWEVMRRRRPINSPPPPSPLAAPRGRGGGTGERKEQPLRVGGGQSGWMTRRLYGFGLPKVGWLPRPAALKGMVVAIRQWWWLKGSW